MAELYKLRNKIRHYEWGSPDCIPRLLGVPGDGRPWAELWMGCHPASPSMISLPETAAEASLGEFIAADTRRYLGEKTAQKYGTLPFLFKLLAAEKPLSIQAHPNLAQAREGYERENSAGLPLDAPNRSYKDANHKPELIVALTPFAGMCGFRSPAETRRLLAEFLELAPASLRESLAPLEQALMASEAASVLRNFMAALFGLSPAAREALTEYILSIREPPLPIPHSPFPIEWEFMRHFARLHPGDPAAISPLYLNVFRLEPGEAIFLKTGTLHSYFRGFGIELMANSDNVLRGGLTGKHVDVPELIKALDFSPSKPQVIRPDTALSCFTYPAPCEEFSLSVIRGQGGVADFAVQGASICIVTEGEAVFSGDGVHMALRQGESAFVPSGDGLTLRGNFTLYAASCPGTP
ncbi:MAG: mannose-6-phosphate isomerase, class I [Treponema sp.]|jgi:mannose-6-phosphate isomerase|nr:mannose-6-phosphate isomerase, class I [Treponema sp.]